MNKWIGIGRLVRDPEIRYSQGQNGQMAIARYTLAVDRRFKKEGEPDADFINCVCFLKTAEFVEKYLKKGMKIAVVGEVRTGSYQKQDGSKVYTTDVVVEQHEFCGTKADAPQAQPQKTPEGGYMVIPEGIEGDLPFK